MDEQYRRSAAALAPAYEYETLAGSGAPGARDGTGLYARFGDPIDISLAPDGKTLAVLDAGARSVRTIEIDSRAVSTLVDWDAVRRAVPSSSGTFARVIAIPGGVVLLIRHPPCWSASPAVRRGRRRNPARPRTSATWPSTTGT